MKQATVIHAINDAAQAVPERVGFRVLRDGEGDVEELTFGELLARSSSFAAVLREHAEPGDRAILFADTGIDTIVALYACLMARLIAVPITPPHVKRIDRRGEILLNIVRDCGPKLILARAELYEKRDEFAAVSWRLIAPKWLRTDRSSQDGTSGPADRELPAPEHAAFLQYTSGTTTVPRGVVVPHGSLLANHRVIYEVTRLAHQQEWAVSWLPLFHDMGISFLFHTPLLQSTCTLLSPAHFVQSPGRWLKTIGRFQAAFSAAPNFALDLAASKIGDAELADIELHSVKALIVGAEPIRPSTIRRFVARFGPRGFERKAIYPCFGLAESTLMATHPRSGGFVVRAFDGEQLGHSKVVEVAAERREDRSGSNVCLVGNGSTGEGHSMLIVDQHTRRALPDGEIGEIWLEGPSVCAGYWGDPEKSAGTFDAEPETPNGKRYLRTGDLGFVCAGELFVAGRIKDLIIVSGRNIFPEDIEFLAERVDKRIVRGGVAAFERVLGNTSGIAILAELSGRTAVDGSELATRIRRSVMSAVEAEVNYVGLLRERRLPRTTSGKISRGTCRKMLERDQFSFCSAWGAHESA